MVLALGQVLIFQILLKRVMLPRFETTKKEKVKAFGAGTFQFGGLLEGAGLPPGFHKRKVSAAVLGSAAVLVQSAYIVVPISGRSPYPPVAAAQLHAVVLAVVLDWAGGSRERNVGSDTQHTPAPPVRMIETTSATNLDCDHSELQVSST